MDNNKKVICSLIGLGLLNLLIFGSIALVGAIKDTGELDNGLARRDGIIENQIQQIDKANDAAKLALASSDNGTLGLVLGIAVLALIVPGILSSGYRIYSLNNSRGDSGTYSIDELDNRITILNDEYNRRINSRSHLNDRDRTPKQIETSNTP